jgi:hypothetical protein
VWDSSGLWVGDLFERCNTASVPLLRYSLSSDNAGGALWTDPTSGDVLYYGGWENEFRVYRVTGWNNWFYARGRIGATAPDSTWVKNVGTGTRSTPRAASGGGRPAPSIVVRDKVVRVTGALDARALEVLDLRGRACATVRLRNGACVANTGGTGAAGVRIVRLAGTDHQTTRRVVDVN